MAREDPDATGPPWRLVGESVVALVRLPRADRRRLSRSLPGGVRPLPWLPAAVVGVAYQDSPVGPYHELSVALPARIGLRPGMCVVLQVVDSPEARMAYRRLWGLPTDLGRFLWSRDGDERSMRWEERGVVVRGEPRGPRFPLGLPLRSVQRRSDGPVVLPRRLWALARAAKVTIDVADPLSVREADVGWLAGSHRGLVLSAARVVASMARHPAGMLSSLRAPHSVADVAIE